MIFDIVTYLHKYYQVFLSQNWWLNILVALAVFITTLLIKGIFSGLIFKLLRKIAQKSKININQEIKNAVARPLNVFFVILGGYLALLSLPLTAEIDALITQLFRALIVLIAAWGVYNLLYSNSFLFRELEDKLNLGTDEILVPFLSKLARIVIIVLTISVIAEEWGYNVNQFVAGLGLGGLALALAAQQTLSNLFAGAMIIVDKPFTVGDWIYTPSVEGVVEEVNFRSTKVRTFPKSLVTVPNAKLASEAITNWSRMPKRRVSFHLGVTYSTSREKLRQCVEDIRALLENHPEVNQEQIMVYFDQFNDSSLDIFVYYFTNVVQWDKYLSIKENINFKTMEILEQNGVSVAFPSRSIYLGNTSVERGDY